MLSHGNPDLRIRRHEQFYPGSEADHAETLSAANGLF
jgi:hypothetical protein